MPDFGDDEEIKLIDFNEWTRIDALMKQFDDAIDLCQDSKLKRSDPESVGPSPLI